MSNPRRLRAPAVVALAGRRIDLPGAQPPRFPLKHVGMVGRRVADALRDLHALALVCSAACGADLVALEQAERLGLRRRIVLPFAPDQFRETSVIDRPGDWGPAFDHQIAAAAAADDLLVLNFAGDNDVAYAAANETIIRETQALYRAAKDGPQSRLIAMLVWEAAARSGSDATAGFEALTRKAGFEKQSISTL